MNSETYSILADFLRYPEGDPDMEELYTRTFDIQAIAHLDVGYVLFGEDYKRGHFLVKMQALQSEHRNDCGTELSDHLPNVLTLLVKMKNEEAAELAGKIVLPAVTKMLEGFSDKGNLYGEVLQAVRETLKQDFGKQDFGRPS